MQKSATIVENLVMMRSSMGINASLSTVTSTTVICHKHKRPNQHQFHIGHSEQSMCRKYWGQFHHCQLYSERVAVDNSPAGFLLCGRFAAGELSISSAFLAFSSTLFLSILGLLGSLYCLYLLFLFFLFLFSSRSFFFRLLHFLLFLTLLFLHFFR